jgi:hypothetical protein
MRRWLAASCVLALSACAGVDPYRHLPIAAHLQRTDAVGDCARLLQRIDRTIDESGRRDAQAPRVDGFPYLRVDRLTARLAPDPTRTEADRDWRDRMFALDREARTFELANAGEQAIGRADAAALDPCRERLAQADRGRHDPRPVAQVPDDYSTTNRVLGLYPLTRLLFASGIRRWHAQTREAYAAPVEKLPRLGDPTRYVPRPPLLLSAIHPDAAPDALGVPQLSAALTEALLERHAPALEVDTVDGNDRLGRLAWGEGGMQVVVDTTQPVAYARIAYTRFAGQVVAQLVYTFWFPARPEERALDVLAGRLDGLVWRVTLGPDLQPLFYDTIHPCGCYHLFFPTPRVRPRAGPIPGEGPYDETMFSPQTVLLPADDERLLLTIASRSHYLMRVTPIARSLPGAVAYQLRDEDDLRALPWPNDAAPLGTRSAYGPDGLVAGSERLERFFFWPMGIESAGQMRQWGRHATAFVGRRHFDDPELFERYFEPAGAP